MKKHYVAQTKHDKCTIPPVPYWPSAESLKTVEIHAFSQGASSKNSTFLKVLIFMVSHFQNV